MAVPTPRASSSLVYFSSLGSSGCLYVFGGGNNNQFFNDMFIFDLATRSWLIPTVSGQSPPAPRAGHSTTRIDQSHFCVIGGGEPATVFMDIHLFNVDTNTWIRVNPAG